ncbi:MAG: AraC family transcriptional regulator [Eubacteriales bacterium]|nr:AraC family transcriptional regulator [Eubacteriales bacterium]
MPDIIAAAPNNYEREITNKMIGRLFSFHPNYINKLMVHNTGKSLHKYILYHRISKAIVLIQSTDKSISEIAYKVGFNDSIHFSKQFKKVTGNKPMHFRRRP